MKTVLETIGMAILIGGTTTAIAEINIYVALVVLGTGILIATSFIYRK